MRHAESLARKTERQKDGEMQRIITEKIAESLNRWEDISYELVVYPGVTVHLEQR